MVKRQQSVQGTGHFIILHSSAVLLQGLFTRHLHSSILRSPLLYPHTMPCCAMPCHAQPSLAKFKCSSSMLAGNPTCPNLTNFNPGAITVTCLALKYPDAQATFQLNQNPHVPLSFLNFTDDFKVQPRLRTTDVLLIKRLLPPLDWQRLEGNVFSEPSSHGLAQQRFGEQVFHQRLTCSSQFPLTASLSLTRGNLQNAHCLHRLLLFKDVFLWR